MAGKDPNKLSEKEARFCLEYVSGDFAGNGTRSFMAAYGTKNVKYATHASSNYLLKKPKVQKEILRLKEKAGLTDEFVRDRIREGLDAKYVSVFKGHARQTDIPDYAVRHRYLETAAKLLEMFPSEKHDHRSINIDIQLEKLSPGEITKLLSGAVQKIHADPKTETRLLGETEK